MRRVLSVGGKCDRCGEHIELRVSKDAHPYAHVIHYAVGFLFGGITAWIIF